jgi:hypothetical protein
MPLPSLTANCSWRNFQHRVVETLPGKNAVGKARTFHSFGCHLASEHEDVVGSVDTKTLCLVADPFSGTKLRAENRICK